jgi:hypothetical protein
MNQIIDFLLSFTGAAITVLIIFVSLIVTKWVFKRITQEKEKSTLTRQVIYPRERKKHFNSPGYLSDYYSSWCPCISNFLTN